jgi:hypothetical protein
MEAKTPMNNHEKVIARIDDLEHAKAEVVDLEKKLGAAEQHRITAEAELLRTIKAVFGKDTPVIRGSKSYSLGTRGEDTFALIVEDFNGVVLEKKEDG